MAKTEVRGERRGVLGGKRLSEYPSYATFATGINYMGTVVAAGTSLQGGNVVVHSH